MKLITVQRDRLQHIVAKCSWSSLTRLFFHRDEPVVLENGGLSGFSKLFPSSYLGWLLVLTLCEFVIVLRGQSETVFYDIPTHIVACGAVIAGALTAYILTSLIRRKRGSLSAGYALLASGPFISFFLTQALSGTNSFTFSGSIFWMNLILYAAVYLIFYTVTNQLRLSIILSAIISLIFGLADYYVMLFRGSPLLPWDLISIKTAMNVADGYTFVMTPNLIMILVILALFILAALCTKDNHKTYIKTIWRRGIVFAATAVFVISLASTSLFEKLGFYSNPWELEASRVSNGSLLNFSLNVPLVMIEKPNGYTAEKAGDIIASMDASASIQESPASTRAVSGVQPKNIFVIMNESLADLKTIDDFETNKDYMPFIRNMSENTIKGNLYVSIFGGRTCCSEFEVLTGNSMAFLPQGSVPYQQYIHEDSTSLASILGGEDYTTYAFHPFLKTAWERDIAYPYLGFEDFFGFYNIAEPKMIRNMVSDRCDYDKLIETYETKDPGSNLFMFNVTIQNHGGYSPDGSFYSTVRLKNASGQHEELEQYLSLVRESDSAFQYLVEYFTEQEEPTMILMFGDHQPKVDEAFYTTLLGKDTESMTLEDQQKKYVTPFVLWANYDIHEQTIDMISANYLSTLLMDTANIELPDYNRFLKQLYGSIPVINVNGYIDAEGNHHSFDEKNEYTSLINDYQILQYNNMFDQKNRISEIYDLSPGGAE